MRTLRQECHDEVSILNDRLVYLNRLRVDVGRSYILTVAAILAFSASVDAIDTFRLLRIGGLPMLFLGLSVLMYDIKNRARAAAVATGIRGRLLEQESDAQCEDDRGLLERLEEDLFFGLTIAVVNSFIFVLFLGSLLFSNFDDFSGAHAAVTPLALVILIALLFGQAWLWRKWSLKWATRMDEWPI